MLNCQTRRVFIWFLGLLCLLFLVITSQEYSSLKSSLVNYVNVTVSNVEENNAFGLDQLIQFLVSKNITKVKVETDGDQDGGCHNHILNTHLYLHQDNVSFSCEALDFEHCPENYER